MKLFNAFRLDTENHVLWRNGDRVPLAPKASHGLAYLVERAGRVVSQDELLEALWPETSVNPEVLRKCIREIRKALGDRPVNPDFIETVPKRGYRFVAPVIDEDEAEPPDATTSHAAEEKLGAATAASEQGSTAVKQWLWKAAIVLVLAVVAAARYSRALPGRTKGGEYFLTEEYLHRRAALCGHEPCQGPGVFFGRTRRTTDSRPRQSTRFKGRGTILVVSVQG